MTENIAHELRRRLGYDHVRVSIDREPINGDALIYDGLLKAFVPRQVTSFGAAPPGSGGDTYVGEGPGIDVVSNYIVGLGGDTILVYYPDGRPVSEFPFDDGGLKNALIEAGSTAAVLLPAGEIHGGPWTVKTTLTGVSFEHTILRGPVFLEHGSLLFNLAVKFEVNDSTIWAGVTCPERGFGRISHVVIHVEQYGSGAAYGIYQTHETGYIVGSYCPWIFGSSLDVKEF